MSAAVNRSHDLLASRFHLPLTGEFHPLRREFERLLATGNAIALTFAMLVCTVTYFWPRAANPIAPPRVVDGPGFFPSPPPIDPSGGGGGVVEMPAVAPDVAEAVIEPVDDEELAQAPAPVDNGPGEGEAGPGPITDLPPSSLPPLDIDPDTPAQEDYVWFDSEPVLLSCEPPVYPTIVREAGIDGTVSVRVLVGVNGKVKRANVVDGPPMLHEAALASAQTAIFKPALQGLHPVEVWVVIPVTFELHGAH